ncbi:MAG: PIN domain-containing protein [Candidatus Anstonellales archaeon]
MQVIIFDTNFLLVSYQFRVDIFSEIGRIVECPYRIIVPSGVVGELMHLRRNKGRVGRAANLAITMLHKLNDEGRIKIVESHGEVDKWIFDFAKKESAIVCTNDILLKRKLLGEGIRIIGLRERSYLALY